jgi:hypothetical protein
MEEVALVEVMGRWLLRSRNKGHRSQLQLSRYHLNQVWTILVVGLGSNLQSISRVFFP